jgi:hypothetical protein
MESRGIIDRRKGIDAIVIALLGLGTLLSRLPFRATLLNTHDAVNYALALEHFDMRLHQPQPPGYPLYVLLGRAFDLILNDHLAALIWLSMVFSGLAAIAIYLGGKELFGRRAGIVAALLVVTSSPFWEQGELPAPYAIDLFFSAMVGWLCYRLITSEGSRAVWSAALALGFAGAFRLQTIMVLFPLFLYALHRRNWRTIAGAIAIAGTVFGLFFVPAVMISGGPAAFLQAMRTTVPIFYSASTLVRSAQGSRFVANLVNILRYTFVTLGELALPLVLLGYLSCTRSLLFWRDARIRFLALWLLPTWVLYFLIWPGNLGTILVCMPPAFLLAGKGLDWVLGRAGWIRAAGYAFLAVLLAWCVVLFCLLPQRPFGDAYRSFSNYASIAQQDAFQAAKLSLVQEVPVEGTIVYANSFRVLQYYLPQYRTFSPPSLYRSDPTRVKAIVSIQDGLLENWSGIPVTTLIPPGTKRIVLYDLPPEALVADPSLVEEREEDGYAIRIVSVPAAANVLWTLEGLQITL